MKTLVVYYSLEGNTKEAAEKVAKALECDFLEIKPKKPLDPNNNSKFAIGGMQAAFGMKPAIEELKVDFEQYDRIILGFPVWAGKCAPYVNTFLKKSRINAKITAVFTCSGGGDNEGCIKKIRKKLPNLNQVVALADKANELAAKNEDNIIQFIRELS